jgi:hypothetical protein
MQKVSELKGTALDWAVSKCLKQEEFWTTDEYSTSWHLAGPIIAQEINRIEEITDGLWQAEAWSIIQEGPTALIAAMRCYVACNMGEAIELPEELDQPHRSTK